MHLNHSRKAKDAVIHNTLVTELTEGRGARAKSSKEGLEKEHGARGTCRPGDSEQTEK